MFNVPSFFGFKSASSFIGLLDLYPNASWGFSFSRRLSGAYSGPLFRVRDTGGNETNIGWDANGDADILSLQNFANGSRATITTVYDQSGNGRDLTQTNLVNQPFATDNSGIPLLKNGRYSPHSPTGYYLINTFSQNPIIGQDAWSLFGVSSERFNTTSAGIYSWGDFGSGTSVRSSIEFGSSNITIRFNNGNNIRNYAPLVYNAGDLFNMCWLYPQNAFYGDVGVEGYLNNNFIPFSSSVNNLPNIANTLISWSNGIGSSTFSNSVDNDLCEYIAYNSYKDVDRDAINQNQIAYYGL